MTDEERKRKKREYMKLWRARHPEKSHEINDRSRKKNWYKWRANALATRRKTYPQKERIAYLARQYNTTPEYLEQLLAKQDRQCPICLTRTPARHGRKTDGYNWHVDHDHETGRIRGLLCFRCNIGIGHLRDNPAFVGRALMYLLHH